MKTPTLILEVTALLGMIVPTTFGQTEKGGTDAPAGGKQQPARSRALTVAVLDFAANTPGEPELGKQIGEALTVMLSGEPGFKLVDRVALSRALQEHELNLSGVVETEQAIKVGKLVGARILVVGKAFAMGKKMFITAKMIGTETSLVDGVIVKGELGDDIGEMVVQLAEKLAGRLREVGPKLVAQEDAGRDPLPALQAQLAKLNKPVVAVIILEEHLGRPRRVPDPAAETEVKLLLRKCGFTVKDVEQNELADFARSLRRHQGQPWPRGLAGVDLVIAGEGYSEFAARIGNLVSCGARVEVNVISRAKGEILLADRTTQRGVDLSENIAGKNALQKAGRVVGLRILEYFSQHLPRETGDDKGDKER